MSFNPGDRVVTPSGKTGTVERSPWAMLHHTLVHFDQSGRLFWILTEILEPLPPSETAKQNHKSRRVKK
jgi:hypothetical protein